MKGKLTVVIGGQYGSESKGKVVSYLADELDLAVRVGAPNAGHTVVKDGKTYKLRQIPAAFLNKNCELAIAAGALINEKVLRDEITLTGASGRITIDPMAGMILEEYADKEGDIMKSIGSVGIGCGYAQVKRLERKDFTFAKDLLKDLKVSKVSRIINDYYDKGRNILIEGSQGFGLSIYHGSYPFVTSRDTTASSFASEAGISPKIVDEIILVIRTFPIRVAGNSGPLKNEIGWDKISEIAGKEVEEVTTVSKKVRRVAEFDAELVKSAIEVNRPTQIALNFLNYLFPSDEDKTEWDDLSIEARNYVQKLEKELGVPITLIGTGKSQEAMVDRRNS